MEKRTYDKHPAPPGLEMTNEIVKRYTLLIASLFVNAFGIACITKASLGTSPISSIPYVLSLFTTPSFGFHTFVLNMFFIVAEILLMGAAAVRRNYPELLVQIPILLIFSVSIDIGMYLLGNWTPSTYPQKFGTLLTGCLILAAGIGWAVKADVAMNPGEYVVNVIARRTGKPFGTVKLRFDVTLMLLAGMLSLCFMRGVHGLREGTIVAALCVGPIERMIAPAWKIFDRWLRPAH